SRWPGSPKTTQNTHSLRILNNTIAVNFGRKRMQNLHDLTEEERARVADGHHNIQAATASLSRVDPRKIPQIESIEECLESADQRLRDVLRTASDTKKSDRKT